MESSIAQEVQEAGQKIETSSGSLSDALNKALNQFLGWPLQAATGFGIDAEGQQTDVFGTVVYTSSKSQSEQDPLRVKADNLACVIDIAENLDEEQLRAAYERIACTKRLKKIVPSNVPGVPYTTVTLGIIFSRDTTVDMETLAEEIDELNAQHPDSEWVDMVVVLSKGTINYGVQLPGGSVSGDFLPPAKGATKAFSAPIYVIILIRPMGAFTFNKMLAFIIAHLMIFSPGAKLSDWNLILEGTPKEAMTLTGYQYNLSGELVPVPRHLYNDRYLPPRPFLIEDSQGKLLSILEFVPWQDGGVVLLRGELPLGGLLVFLGEEALKRGGIIKHGDTQISYVLPITQADFTKMIQKIQVQSNMVVKLDQTKVVAQKMVDEGTSTPFMARLYFGILRLRDAIFPNSDSRQTFDVPYHFVMETLMNTRSTSGTILDLISGHFGELAKGKVAKMHGNTIQIEKSIDNELRKEVESFLNSSVRAIKQGMQDLAKALQVDIGFLFQKQANFESGLVEMEQSDPLLAPYLGETRKWSEPLLNSRNAIEHEGWILHRVRYKEISGVIHAEEPEISGQKVSNFVEFVFDRLSCFVEEVTAHCLQARMPTGISVTEIPLDRRKQDIAERFQLTVTNGGKPIWHINYHETEFDQT